jgi:hypothetical protein
MRLSRLSSVQTVQWHTHEGRSLALGPNDAATVNQEPWSLIIRGCGRRRARNDEK